MSYDQWKTRDPNEPFAEHEEEQMPMPTEPTALLPCPFCGRPGAICVLEDEPDSPAGFWVNCFCGVETGERATEQEAIDHWNTRVAPAQGEPVVGPGHPVFEETRAAITAAREKLLAEYKAENERLRATISPEDLAEECAKIAEGHVGAGGYPGNELEDRCRRIGYDDACRDIAKAIRDVHGGRSDE